MVELGTTNVKFYADQPFNLILTIPLIKRATGLSAFQLLRVPLYK